MIRHGAAVPGLQPGTLLVASRQLDGTLFAQSVILMYESGHHGMRGVMLTQVGSCCAPAASTSMV
jgi:putative AlgH/UPF0301 family transcriptional regulator